jgi:hypothetical protein
MLDLIKQLKNACEASEDFEQACNNTVFKKEDMLEWKAALVLEQMNNALSSLTDNAEYADKGLYISYKQYARFLAAYLMVLHDGQ